MRGIDLFLTRHGDEVPAPMTEVDFCLATYGTLAPGKPNHHRLAHLGGTWIAGKVRGTLVATGWGAAMGYPALTLDPSADFVPVQVLVSDALADQWDWLDGFEGSEYQRTLVRVETDEGPLQAWIYLAAGS